jgi:hypothetical protein
MKVIYDSNGKILRTGTVSVQEGEFELESELPINELFYPRCTVVNGSIVVNEEYVNKPTTGIYEDANWIDGEWVISPIPEEEITRLKTTEKKEKIGKINQTFIDLNEKGYFLSVTLGKEINGGRSAFEDLQGLCVLPITSRPNFFHCYDNTDEPCSPEAFDAILIEIVQYNIGNWMQRQADLHALEV